MSHRITVERVDTVPDESRVCHYDELDDDAKAQLPALAGATDTRIDGTVADDFRGCDLVKFTEYYEISVH